MPTAAVYARQPVYIKIGRIWCFWWV